jgi:hypothetical protein
MALQKIRGTALYFIILFILTLFVYCRVLYAIIPSATSQSVEKEVSNQQRLVAKSFFNETSDSIDIEEERKATATILSRTSQLSKLLINLDAGDVIEVYVVNRMAPLTRIVSSSSRVEDSDKNVHRMLDESRGKGSKTEAKGEGDTSSSATPSSNIPSGPILVRKSALAFRYRSRVALASHGHHFSDEHLENLSPGDQLEQQKYFELTLEFGPQRTGVAKTAESIPIVHIDTEHQTTDDNNDNGKYVSWQNEGSIYYSTKISHDFTDAYYMASITGVVLEKIIQRAIQYTYKHPRYQPFEVISIPSQKQILKSSGSEDFVWHMFHELSDLFVDIDPLVLPPRARVQFYVSDVEEDEKDDNQSTNRRTNPNIQKVEGTLEASQAALFYEKFINCASAIRTGDYSMYMPVPSSSDDMVENKTTTTIRGEDMYKRRLSVDNNTSDDQAELINNTVTYGLDTLNTNSSVGESNATSASNSTLTNATILEIIEDDPAEVAEKAAVEAVKAADIAVEAVKAAENATTVTANSSSVVSIVQNATIEASKAAQKAHDLSVAARSKASAEALISGDGDAVTSVLSTCFSDTKYDILEQGQESGEDTMDGTADQTSTVVAYIYIDGHTFFKLNLAAPYWRVLASTISIPPPLMPKRGSSDLSDWLIILFLLSFTLFGFIVMMHQIGVCFIDERLRFRQLFHPTNSLSSYHRRTGPFGVVEGELPLLTGRDDGVYLRGSLTCNNEKKRESND